MEPIFKDIALQKQFDEEGYVIIPFLSDEDISALTELFYKFHTETKDNYFEASTYLNSTAEKIKIRDTLNPFFQRHLENVFQQFTYIGSAFLYKTPGNESDVPPHQDWTIVDETASVAINIWTPLTDTSEENGTLYVIPKSQSNKLFSLRAPTIPFYYQKYINSVVKCCIPTNAKAGEAVILNQSLIHYSSPNKTNKIRLAITTGIKTKSAPMLFHYRNTNNEIEQYEVSEDFLSEFDDFERDIYKKPKNGKYIQTLKYTAPQLSKLGFMKLYGSGQLSFLEKLKIYFD